MMKTFDDVLPLPPIDVGRQEEVTLIQLPAFLLFSSAPPAVTDVRRGYASFGAIISFVKIGPRTPLYVFSKESRVSGFVPEGR